MSSHHELTRLSPIAAFFSVMISAARIQNLKWASNIILLIQRPLTPALSFIATLIAYQISNQTAVAEEHVVGFLIVGALAIQAWNASIWASGFGLQMDAFEGTLPSVFASPASKLAVVAGYGLGDLVLSLPSVLVIVVVGQLFGASYDIGNPFLAALALLLIFVTTLIIGIAFAGVFILSRNANPLANFLQAPIYILTGFYFPRSVLPGWLEYIGAAIPITHAVTMLRATILTGAGWNDIASDLGKLVLSSALFLIIGIWALGRVDYELRRTGSLNLF